MFPSHDRRRSAPTLAEELTQISGAEVTSNTVYKWRRQNRIPSDYWKDLITAGEKRNFGLTSDLLTEIAKERAVA